MAVRKIFHRTNNNVSYLMYSEKMNAQVHCESGLERSLALMMEMAPNVASFREQPVSIRVNADGLSFTTVPDFEVTLKTGEVEYVEVKHSSKVKKINHKLNATAKQLASEGFVYKVKTEIEIRRCEQILQNCLTLKAFKRTRFYKPRDLKLLVPKMPITFGELAKTLGSENTVMEMIAQQLVYCDYYQPINASTVIRPLKEGDFDFLYL